MNKVIFISIFILLAGCREQEQQVQVVTGEAIGTSYQLKFFNEKELSIQKDIDSIFEALNQSMSTYRENSDISRINAGDTAVVVDDDFREVYLLAQKIYVESNGYFDPTVGNLVNAYGFGPEAGQVELSQEEIDSMLQYVGFNKLTLTEENLLLKMFPEIYLDFNAIAKGYGVDLLARYLDQRGVEDYLVEVGGELVARGMNRDKNSVWTVGIDDPLQEAGTRTLTAALRLENRAMATSGNYRKFREDSITGQRFVHTINPLTGKSQRSNLLSATVLAPNCTLADGYATAFMALGLEGTLEMLANLDDVDVYLIYSEENEEVATYATPGFENVLLKE